MVIVTFVIIQAKVLPHRWRLDAIEIFTKLGYQGELYIPEPEGCVSFSKSELDGYERQILWERDGLARAKVILFWIPRELGVLDGFTTNIEFGEWYKTKSCVLGYPSYAKKMGYIRQIAMMQGIPISDNLQQTVENALELYHETDHHSA